MERENPFKKEFEVVQGKIIEVNKERDGTLRVVYAGKGRDTRNFEFSMNRDYQKEISFSKELHPGMDVVLYFDDEDKIRVIERILH